MNLKEIDINSKNWVGSAQNIDYWRALVNVTEPPDSINQEFSYLMLRLCDMTSFHGEIINHIIQSTFFQAISSSKKNCILKSLQRYNNYITKLNTKE